VYASPAFSGCEALLLHEAYPDRERGVSMSQQTNQYGYPVPQRASLYRQQMNRRTTGQRAPADDEDDPYTTRTPRSAVVRYRPPGGTLQGLPKMQRAKWRLPWYFYASMSIAGIIVLYIVVNIGGTWIQRTRDDWTYGNPRTYQTDANVGHGTSQAPLSHFIAENLTGQVIVIEIPGGEPGKAHIYTITTLAHGSNDTPVTVSCKDINADGKLDLLVSIGEPDNPLFVVMLFNNGQTFVPKL